MTVKIIGAIMVILLMGLLLLGCSSDSQETEPTAATSKTAKIEITFSSNPVPCKDKSWKWRVILTEVNGVGVKLDSLTYERYANDLVNKKDYDSSWIEGWLDSAYLPASGSANFGAGFPCQAITYALFTVTGIDDNGNQIEADGRVDFQR